ncbi:hypothetical protein B9C99_16220 [Rhodococcus sp. BUPNP1]|nr:hypothetical protein B9C99_16220 [Rhodococcus sp. BUPNP1]
MLLSLEADARIVLPPDTEFVQNDGSGRIHPAQSTSSRIEVTVGIDEIGELHRSVRVTPDPRHRRGRERTSIAKEPIMGQAHHITRTTEDVIDRFDRAFRYSKTAPTVAAPEG